MTSFTKWLRKNGFTLESDLPSLPYNGIEAIEVDSNNCNVWTYHNCAGGSYRHFCTDGSFYEIRRDDINRDVYQITFYEKTASDWIAHFPEEADIDYVYDTFFPNGCISATRLHHCYIWEDTNEILSPRELVRNMENAGIYPSYIYAEIKDRIADGSLKRL